MAITLALTFPADVGAQLARQRLDASVDRCAAQLAALGMVARTGQRAAQVTVTFTPLSEQGVAVDAATEAIGIWAQALRQIAS